MPPTKRSEFLHLYEPAERQIIFNRDDPDLPNILVELPAPPPAHKIDGYGLHPYEQRWAVPEMPEPLQELNAKRYTNVELYWREIEQKWDYYEPHLGFIRQHWERRLNGYWVYIKGKPTYIPPWHYFALTAGHLNSEIKNIHYGVNLPEYRDRDRRFFLFSHWCDDNPFVFGFNYPKHRREGATSKASNINVELATREAERHNGIQSMTEPDARDKVFSQFIVPICKNLPFYFQPIAENYRDPKSMMSFRAGRSKEYSDRMPVVLNSQITYGIASRNAYDGEKLRFHHGDEEGKTEEEDVLARWRVNRKALSTGNGSLILGLHIATSTVGEMKGRGGQKFKKKCVDSNWGKRDETGQTGTGLVTMFMPAEDGLEGFIDPWGQSVIENPTTEDLKHLPSIRRRHEELARMYEEAGQHRRIPPMGSRAYLKARRDFLTERGDNEALSEELRQTPQKFRECFSVNADECRFDSIILQTRLQEFTVGDNPFVSHGRFAWVNQSGDLIDCDPLSNPRSLPRLEDLVSGRARVTWIPQDDYRQAWEVSHLPPERMANKFEWDQNEQIFMPANTRFYGAGADPQKTREKTSTGTPSLSSTAILRKKNSAIDLPIWTPTMRVQDEEEAKRHGRTLGDYYHITDRFCALWLSRPRNKEDYLEQTLMSTIYYGCFCCPEINVYDVLDWYYQRGFPGWLKFRYDPRRDDLASIAGVHVGARDVDEIFNAWRDHIKKNGHREVHLALLQQAFDIRLEMHDFDAFAAGGQALLEDADRSYFAVEAETSEIDLDDGIGYAL
jgi:hypothetical protein